MNSDTPLVWTSAPRKTAQVHFPDGRTFEAAAGTELEQYFRTALGESGVPFIAALVNGELRELTYQMWTDAAVEPLFLSDSDGIRIYRRSLSFLLITVVRELFPEASVFVDHSLPFGGFFCAVGGRKPFTEEELVEIEGRMHQIVEEDFPIQREQVPLSEGLELFRGRGEMDKAKLQLDMLNKQANAQLQAERISSENQRAGAQIGARLATELDKAQREDKREGARLGIEIAKELSKGDG